jgi:hypothetical protein
MELRVAFRIVDHTVHHVKQKQIEEVTTFSQARTTLQ